MPGGFSSRSFAAVDLDDPFFDSLKVDYPDFSDWYARKATEGATALVVESDLGAVEAFVYLKDETDEEIELVDGVIPAGPRLKIGTLKIADEAQGERLGEGAIGLALWRWRDSGVEDVYVTVFEKHASLVGVLTKFGFAKAGMKPNGEAVFIKSRSSLQYADSYTAFPFLDPTFVEANLLTIDDVWHDVLFPYSELANELQESVRSGAANGVTKVYIGAPAYGTTITPGQPLLVYRRYTGTTGTKAFKSVITSYCMVTDVVWVKSSGRPLLSYAEYLDRIGNKSVFEQEQLREWYDDHRQLVIIEMIYLGYFGAGNNVNWSWLKDNGYWQDTHPYQFRYTRAEFEAILAKGGIRVEDAVID